MALIKNWFHTKANGFGIATFEGNKGDYFPLMVEKPFPRKNYLHFNVLLRGAMKMVLPSGEVGWRYTPGMTSDEGGDFTEVGEYRWTADEDKTQELCITPFNPDNSWADDAVVERKVFDMNKTGRSAESQVLEAGAIAVVARGAFQVIGNNIFKAPHFITLSKAAEFVALEPNSRLISVRRA